VAVRRVLDDEAAAGLESLAAYASFQSRVEAAKAEILTFLIAARAEGKRVAGYGAPGKANTFLNFCGIRTDLLAFTVDRNPYKHGRFTPGTHIPIHPIDYLDQERPDVVWILPWNLRTEIAAQLAPIAERGGRFLVAIPHVELLD
jgi:hypothetical protein